ncbi:MAG: hypothetical protein ABIU08_03685 [Acidimicrobiales bacterium]
MGRPFWTAFAYDLAQRLGIAEVYATHTRPFEDPTQADDHRDLGSALSMTTLRQELRRRGWNETDAAALL